MTMDLLEIDFKDRAEARQRFIEYRAAVRERHNAEDYEIMQGYKALANGHTLIRLADTINLGGLNEQNLPALAIAPALAEWCFLHGGWGGSPERGHSITFSRNQNSQRRNTKSTRTFTEMFKGHEMRSSTWSLRAMVPPVPPRLRPSRGLGVMWTLFEVPKWEPAPRPPGDPALLRHIGGDLYAVMATWDLTDLEIAVLAGRRP
jgi:hypothetical protein